MQIFTGLLGVMLFIALLCVAPLIGLWSLNTIFEQSNIACYIPHNVWSYLAVWGLVSVFRGGKQ